MTHQSSPRLPPSTLASRSPQAPSLCRREIAELDGLRALAILLVLWCHLTAFGAERGLNVGPPLLHLLGDFGFAGVLLFFVLSGFLLFLPFARALLVGTPWPSARTFYQRRARRILPAYWVALVVLLGLFTGFHLTGDQLLSFPLLVLLLQDGRSTAFALSSQLDGPFWTLTIEWQFYLLLPLLALTLARLARRQEGQSQARRLALGLGLLILLGLSERGLAAFLHYRLGQAQPVALAGPLGWLLALLYGTKGKYLEVFALGMGASLLYVAWVEQGRLTLQRRQRLGSWLLGLALSSLALNVAWATQAGRIPYLPNTFWWLFVPPAGWLWQIGGEWSIGISFACLLLGMLLGPAWLRAVVRAAPLRWIGQCSYSVYLWHFPLLIWLSATAPVGLPWASLRFVGLSLAVIFLLGAASYNGLERPFLRYRHAAGALSPAPQGFPSAEAPGSAASLERGAQ